MQGNAFLYSSGICLCGIKNRWLLVEFIPFNDTGATFLPSEGITSKHIWNALKESVISNFGDTGWGAVGMSLTGELYWASTDLQTLSYQDTVKYFSPTTNLCIIRVGRDHHRIAWGAVTLVKKLQGKTYLPNVIHLSGEFH